MHAHCGILRERLLRAADACFGHRLMMDRIVPGGVVRDIAADGIIRLKETVADIRSRFPRLVSLYDNTASFPDRTVRGQEIVRPELALQFGAGGCVGRASNRNFDARKVPGYPPYGELSFEIPVLADGDVNARVWVRVREVEQSLSLVEQIFSSLPDSPVATQNQGRERCWDSEGLGLCEGFRGDVLAWVRLSGHRVVRCHLRDPSWFQWPLLGSRHRREHRRRFPAVQQILQLLLFGARSLKSNRCANSYLKG